MLALSLVLLLAGEGGPGPLVLVGGGRTPEEVPKTALKLAGGPKARVVLLPQASALPTAGADSLAYWRRFGPAAVDVADFAKPDAAKALIAQADLIWMPGGDQSRLTEALRKAGLAEDVRRRWRAGAVVGGTSAGAAVASRRMFTGATRPDGGPVLADGLDLWPGVLVDQHFRQRNRWPRLFAAVLEDPKTVGVGLDEGTAAVVRGDSFEVIGANCVTVVDARGATLAARPDGPPSAVGIRVHLLRPGMTHRLTERQAAAKGPF